MATVVMVHTVNANMWMDFVGTFSELENVSVEHNVGLHIVMQENQPEQHLSSKDAILRFLNLHIWNLTWFSKFVQIQRNIHSLTVQTMWRYVQWYSQTAKPIMGVSLKN